MPMLLQYSVFLALVVLTLAGKENWYRMETEYGPVTLDNAGWAKPDANNRDAAVLFEDFDHKGNMYIMIRSGRYTGYYFSGDISKGAGAWKEWRDAAYMKWDGCTLISQSFRTRNMPLTYATNGYFYFQKPSQKFQQVCIRKVYPNRNIPCTATRVVGRWKYLFTISGKTTVSLKHGTAKRYEESKSSEWGLSVSSQISASFAIKGVFDVGVQAGYEVRTSIASSYANEWSSNKEETWTVEFAETDRGKALWQFIVDIQDSCTHAEETLLREYALTPSKNSPPCCIPGYAADAPRYSQCTSEADLIEKSVKGCVVTTQRRGYHPRQLF